MGRRSDRWKKGSEFKEPNLVPVMNMIAILIPVLLMQQEYIKIAAIDVNTPIQAPPKASTPEPPNPDEKKLNLTLSVTSLGFYLHAGGEMLPGGEDTEEGNKVSIGKIDVEVWTALDKETNEPVEVARIYEHKGKKYVDGVTPITDEELNKRRSEMQEQQGSAFQIRAEKDFNYPALNLRLARIKEAYKKEDKVFFNPEPNIPFWQIVRTMDASRNKIEKAVIPPERRATMTPDALAAEEARLAEENALFYKVIFGTISVGG